MIIFPLWFSNQRFLFAFCSTRHSTFDRLTNQLIHILERVLSFHHHQSTSFIIPPLAKYPLPKASRRHNKIKFLPSSSTCLTLPKTFIVPSNILTLILSIPTILHSTLLANVTKPSSQVLQVLNQSMFQHTWKQHSKFKTVNFQENLYLC